MPAQANTKISVAHAETGAEQCLTITFRLLPVVVTRPATSRADSGLLILSTRAGSGTLDEDGDSDQRD